MAATRSIWRWLGANDAQLKIVFSLVAAAYIVFQYASKMQEDRVARALNYVERYNKGDVAASRSKLDQFWQSASLAKWREKLNPGNYSEVMPKIAVESGLLAPIETVMDFYKELALCVDGNICDAKTTCHFFFTDLQAFRQNYEWHLKELEKEWRDSAPRIIGTLASGACADDLKTYCAVNPTSNYCTGKAAPRKS